METSDSLLTVGSDSDGLSFGIVDAVGNTMKMKEMNFDELLRLTTWNILNNLSEENRIVHPLFMMFGFNRCLTKKEEK